MTQEKAIQEAKDRVAKRFKYRDWNHLIKVLDDHVEEYGEFDEKILNAHIDEAMLEYASSSSEKGDAHQSSKQFDLEKLLEWVEKQLIHLKSKSLASSGEFRSGRIYQLEHFQDKLKSLTPKEHSEGEQKCVTCGGAGGFGSRTGNCSICQDCNGTGKNNKPHNP